MKEVVVISGKGGTGKTSITAGFAALAQNAVLADCDVDAADLHIIMEPRFKQITDFVGGKQAHIETAKCVSCGKCKKICKFDAINLDGPANDIVAKTYTVDPISCEGCKVCVEFCPVDAIRFEDSINGQWFVSETRFGPMVHAKLGIAQENSGKLVTLIRNRAKEIAEQNNHDMLLIDGSPGIGCPVIASITGADLVLIVTEPTLSGKHDLERVAKLASNLKVPAMVCINKSDINPEIANEIKDQAEQMGLNFAGQVEYSEQFTKAQVNKLSIIEYDKSQSSKQIENLWRNIINQLNKKEQEI